MCIGKINAFKPLQHVPHVLKSTLFKMLLVWIYMVISFSHQITGRFRNSSFFFTESVNLSVDFLPAYQLTNKNHLLSAELLLFSLQ